MVQTNKDMKTTYKGFEIDYQDGAACIMNPKFKGFASDEISNGKSGLEKAKLYIDSINGKFILKTNKGHYVAHQGLNGFKTTKIIEEAEIFDSNFDSVETKTGYFNGLSKLFNKGTVSVQFI